jgi:nicotinate-nucleotide adenylyltransferase
MMVGLLGGSFDPLHLGHLRLGAALQQRCALDALWLLPVARHVFGKSLSPFADRLAMAALGAQLLGPGAEARDTEAQLVAKGGDGSSVELLRHLTAVHPEAHFRFAMGADAWAQRAAWREFDVLAALAEVVVFNREGVPEVEGAGPPLPNVSSSAIRERVRAGESIATLVPAEIDRYIRARGLYR